MEIMYCSINYTSTVVPLVTFAMGRWGVGDPGGDKTLQLTVTVTNDRLKEFICWAHSVVRDDRRITMRRFVNPNYDTDPWFRRIKEIEKV